MRSHLYFIESIYHRDDPLYFRSQACESYESFYNQTCDYNAMQVPMGEGLKKNMIEGIQTTTFYLDTRDEPPFSLTTS